MKQKIKLVGKSFLIVACLTWATGCNRDATPGAAAGPPKRPPPEVDVVPALEREITDYREYTGRTAAVDSVEVRARVSGYLVQSPRSVTATAGSNAARYALSNNMLSMDAEKEFTVNVSEGDMVEAGTPLFEIDPAPYRLALEQALGSLDATTAQRQRLDSDLTRAKELYASRSISKADYDLAVAEREEVEGQIQNLSAAVERARLDLSYTQVVAPIDGLIGRTLVTEGNLISADTTVLTTIVSQDPIYVYFDIDERSLLDYRSRIRSGSVKSARNNSLPIEMGLANDDGFPYQGTIDFVDNQTNADTGNTRLRGTFANPEGALTPGLFARIRAPFTSKYKAVLIPTKALATDQQGRYVMVVDESNIAHRRTVAVGSEREGMSAVLSGLEVGEEVIVTGLQKVSEGVPVVKSANRPNPTDTVKEVGDIGDSAPSETADGEMAEAAK